MSDVYFVNNCFSFFSHKYSNWCTHAPPPSLIANSHLPNPHTLFPSSIMMAPMAHGRLYWGYILWHSTQVQEVPSGVGGEWNQCQWSSELNLCIFWHYWWGTWLKQEQISYLPYCRRGSGAISNWEWYTTWQWWQHSDSVCCILSWSWCWV